MNNTLALFSQAEGNILIRLLLAHMLADFMFQTTDMVAQKKWLSKYMVLHIAIVFSATWLLGGNIFLALFITPIHWIIDGIKISLKNKEKAHDITLFIADQLLHVLSIVILWALFAGHFKILLNALELPFTNYKLSLILSGYIFVTTPVGFLIKNATAALNSAPNSNVQKGGKWIGIFERIIIVTFILVGQYEAIGFLITGKSIIRFANQDEHLQSEYVLLGTMMSYALAILTGAGINWLLSI